MNKWAFLKVEIPIFPGTECQMYVLASFQAHLKAILGLVSLESVYINFSWDNK